MNKAGTVFEQRKKSILGKIETNFDRSRKGGIDERILSLIETINSSNDFVTTSSCSGRIVLLYKNDESKKYQVQWLYTTHDMADYETVKAALKSSATLLEENPGNKVYLLMEAPILHVQSRNVENGLRFLELARNAGMKHGGLISASNSKFIFETYGNERIEILVASEGKVHISDDYLEVLISESNQKLRKCHEGLDMLEEEFKNEFIEF